MIKVINIFSILIFIVSCTPKIYIGDVEWCSTISESRVRVLNVTNDTLYAYTNHRIVKGNKIESDYNYWDAIVISKKGKVIKKISKVPIIKGLYLEKYFAGNEKIEGLEGFTVGQNLVKSKFVVEELYVTSKQSFMPIRFGGYMIYFVIIKYNNEYYVFELDNTNFSIIKKVTLFGNKYLILNYFDVSAPIFEDKKICMLDLEKIIKKYID